MSNWVGGLPAEPKAKEDKKKAKKGPSKPASPPDGAHPKTFFGGAIPPVPPNLPKYKKDDPPTKVQLERHCGSNFNVDLQVIITGAGHPLIKSAPSSPKAPPPSPPSPPATPATPPTPSSPPQPPPPPSPASDSTLQSYSPPPPTRLPSVFDKKKKKKKKKKQEKKPPPPKPKSKPIECCDDDICGDSDGDGDLSNLPSIFAICHIPATRQGQGGDDSGGHGEVDDRSGQASPRSGEDDDGPDIPPAVPSYMRPDEFAGIFGKKIDARNVAEMGPHGWHPEANAPYDITDTGDTVTVSSSGWHEPRSE